MNQGVPPARVWRAVDPARAKITGMLLELDAAMACFESVSRPQCK